MSEFGKNWPSGVQLQISSTGPLVASPPPPERRLVTTTLFEAERHDDKWPTDNAVEFVAWLQGLIDQVPGEFRANVSIEIESGGGYDGDAPSIEVAWSRPETDLEMHDRQRAEALAAHRRAEEQAAQERHILAALKAKYEK